jgi:hypothetical protein
LAVARKQFWLGPHRAGLRVTFWVDRNIIHLLIGGVRVKTVRSHLSSTDRAALLAAGGRPAGPPPLPPPDHTTALEVERAVGSGGIVSLGTTVLAAEILSGTRVGIRSEGSLLSFFDPQTRHLLRTRPNPFSYQQTRLLRGAPTSRATATAVHRTRPVTRRTDKSGTLMIVGQRISLGRPYANRSLTIYVAATTLTIDLADGNMRTITRTNTKAVRSIKEHNRKSASKT